MINFSDKENRQKLIDIELNSLNATLSIQKNLNKQILVFMKNFIGNIEINLDFDPTNKAFEYMNKSTSMLNKSNSNIDTIQKLIKKLNTIKTSIQEKKQTDIEGKLKSYNNQFNKAINPIYKNTNAIEEFIHEIALLDLSDLLKEVNQTEVEEFLEEENELENITIQSETIETSFVENTLVISETRGKVILPYQIETVKNFLLNNRDSYSSIADVIRRVYTKPLKKYKFSSMARFREAYKLMIEKEHTSKFKAFSLASELFGNYNLHPAVITACKSLDELDIYLACLEDNTLEDFPFFDIKYEIPPVVVPNTNNAT